MASAKSHTFDVFYRRGWVYLVVYPDATRNRAVYPEEIENRMRVIGMPKAPTAAIRGAIADATGEAVALVEWPDGERLAATFDVAIAEDEMSASVTVTPPKRGAAPPTVDDVVAVLAEGGAVFGADREAIAALLAEKRYNEAVTVARGREPVFGRSRRVEYRFKLNRSKPYLEMPFGRINLKELNFIDNKHVGDVLAVLLPPVEAVDGSTVTGRRIPAERDESHAEIPAGENTRLSSDGSELTAEVDGNVRFRDGVVIVEPVVEVENVDYSTGNIHFEGSVVVNGSVADGFVVEAGGNIQVARSVGRATLRAGENILLQSGMNGNGDGILECGGNLFARYLESCTVRCRGNVLVEEAIMHSTVVARSHCLLNGKRAEFIAGECLVGGTLWCKKLGNMYDAKTHVSVGVPPEVVEEYRASYAEMIRLEDEVASLQEKVARLERAIAEGGAGAGANGGAEGSAGATAEGGAVPGAEGGAAPIAPHKLTAARDQLAGQLESGRRRLAELRRGVPALKERLDPDYESLVVVEDTMFNGTVVAFGAHEYRPPHTGSHKTILQMSHGAIHASGYDAHDPPVLSFDDTG